LQSRLYNILKLEFLRKYYLAGDEAQKTYAVQNTLYVVAQYLGWSEILRREIQLLSFSRSRRTRAVAMCQRRVVEAFQDDSRELGRPFLLWRGEQRAIGELMIDDHGAQVRCLGYAGFLGREDTGFRGWFRRLEAEIASIANEPNRRLVELQHALVDLVRELDPKRRRYVDDVLQKV
jgi:hypothetical protein